MTRTMTRFTFGGLLATLLLATATPAEEPTGKTPATITPGKTYLVLVGISDYADKQIKPRLHAEADAKAFYDLFTDKQYLGVPADQAKLLTGAKATRQNILDALKWAATKAETNDLVVYGFFGQGGPIGDSGDRTGYFASDSTFKNRGKDMVAAAEIGDALKTLKSTRFCVFMDVNFKGFVSGEKGVVDASLGQTPYKEFLGDDGTEDHASLPGRVLFLATNGLSQSIDGTKNGIFTEVVLNALKGAADKEGYEPDGIVTVDELAKQLDKDLPPLAAKLGKTKEEKEAAHFVLGTRDAHFGLTKNPAETAKVEGRLAKFEALVKNGKIAATFATEGKGLLERMPKLEAQRKLRAEYQALVDGKTDLAGFEKARTAIIDSTKLRRSDALSFATKVMDAASIVRKEHVKEVTSAQLVEWGVKGLYRRLEEKLPTEVEAKLKELKDLREADQLQVVVDARMALGKREDLDNSKDLTITLQRMLSNMDPYTTYIDAEQKAKFEQDTRGNFTGIGIQIRKDAASDQLLVVTPIWNSPAHKAGLQAGDVVTKIVRTVDSFGKRLDVPETILTKGLLLSDAVKKILGKEGTQVTLVVTRDGAEKEITITRARILTESVLGYKREDGTNAWDYWLDPKNKIVYIRLTSFQEFSDQDMRELLLKLKADKGGVKGLVFDLRFNPGGYLTSAVKISDLLIDDGKIVGIRPRGSREQTYSGKSDGSLLDFPVVCLVNGFSASGSEIVSAALQDHKRALILGERSYGKGSVQHTQQWEDGLLKFTVASFWRPSGVNLNKPSTTGKDDDQWGVTPDKLVPLSRKERDDLADAHREAEIILPAGKAREKSKFEDKQLDAALEYLREQIKGGKVGGR